MTTIADNHAFVISVDTHARTHTYSVVAATGQHIDTAGFPNSKAGRARAIAWAARRTEGDLGVLWVIERTGSYGALLAGNVATTGYHVIEAPRVVAYAKARNGSGTSDPLDARAIAAASLSLEQSELRFPRLDEGARASLRVLLSGREQLTLERTAKVNALTALLRSVDLGFDARSALSGAQIATISRWRGRAEEISIATARTEAIRLAKRVAAVDRELKDNQTQLVAMLEATPAAALLEETGIGPVNAAVVYTAWSHLGRVRSEAAFAALAGVNPIPASSGNTVRHRLNRGGDRQLNRAFNVMAMVRMVHHPETRRYVEKRRADGKTDREIRRLLKRYLARRIYRHFNNATTLEQRG